MDLNTIWIVAIIVTLLFARQKVSNPASLKASCWFFFIYLGLSGFINPTTKSTIVFMDRLLQLTQLMGIIWLVVSIWPAKFSDIAVEKTENEIVQVLNGAQANVKAQNDSGSEA